MGVYAMGPPRVANESCKLVYASRKYMPRPTSFLFPKDVKSRYTASR